jgi:hypothetical protein
MVVKASKSFDRACGLILAGSIVPVPRGTMRNVLFPEQRAEYISLSEWKAMGISRASLQRDRTFRQHPKKNKSAAVTELVQPVQPNTAGDAQLSNTAEANNSPSQSQSIEMENFRTLGTEKLKTQTEALP